MKNKSLNKNKDFLKQLSWKNSNMTFLPNKED